MTTLAFCKPFQVLCQFSPSEDKRTLADYISTPDVYPAGRLDYDSEGLLLLTDNGSLQNRISSPQFKLEKTYWVQVEGAITEQALQQLQNGVALKDGQTAPASAQEIDEPAIWLRNPPIRQRQSIPTSWLALSIREGRNRQVRRMTAAVGFPTLRLIRSAIGPVQLGHLQPGEYHQLDEQAEFQELLKLRPARAPGRSPGHRRHLHKPKSPRRSSRPRK